MKPLTESKTDVFFPVMFLLLAAAYIIWTWNHELAGMDGDNTIYLLMAQNYSLWDQSSSVSEYFAQKSHYPPLFPLILSLFDGGKNLLFAHLYTTICLLLSFVILRSWYLTLGLNKSTADMTVLLFALMPGTVKLAMFIFSENQYLLFTLIALTAVARFDEKNNGHYLLVAALAIGAATLTRTVGISLAVAFSLYLMIRRPNRAIIMGLLAILPFLFVLFMKNVVKENIRRSYLEDFIAHYSEAPVAKLLNQIETEFSSLWKAWHSNFEPGVLSFIITFFLIVCLLGFAIRLYQRRMDAFYLLFYFLLILIWPYPAESKRFIYVALPILFGQGILLIHHLSKVMISKRILQPTLLFLLLLLISSLPTTAFMVNRFLQPMPIEFEQYRRNKYYYVPNYTIAMIFLRDVKVLFEDLQSLDSKLSTNAIIYGIAPPIISYHSNRLSLKTPGPNSDWESFLDKTTNSANTYFYMMSSTSPSVKTPYYPLELIRNRIEIVHVVKAYEDDKAPVVAILAKVKE
jgi:hypothetical protein